MRDSFLEWLAVHIHFIGVVILVSLARIFLSRTTLSPTAMAGTLIVAIASAVVCTAPTLHYLELDADVYQNVVAAVWALAGEGVARSIVRASNEVDWIRKLVSRLIGRDDQ